MNLQRILDEAKSSINHYTHELTYDNLEEFKETISTYVDFLHSAKKLSIPPIKDLTEPLQLTKNDVISEAGSVPQTDINHSDASEPEYGNDLQKNEAPPITQVDEKERKEYRFERKVNGGFLTEIDAFVPEKEIRKLELRNGDFLYAKPLTYSNENGPKPYYFEVARRMNEPEPKERVQYNHCIVKKLSDLDRLIVEDTIDGIKIMFDELQHALTIPHKDITRLQIKEGSIVDIAYYVNDPQGTMRVIWNHATEDNAVQSRPQKGSYYKKMKSSNEKDKEDKPVFNFENKRILLVGCEFKKGTLRDLVHKYNGEFDWASGNETDVRLKAMIQKADLVLLNTLQVKHNGTIRSVQYCKEHKVPFDTIESYGNTIFAQKAESLLG